MDFFSQQESAHRNTRRLVVLFFVAVVAVVAAVNLAVVLIFYGARLKGGVEAPLHGGFDPKIALGVTVATLVVMAAASLYKIAALSGGGQAVAQLLGGRPVDPNTTDLNERRLLNVVEEMALASGTPVPAVYLLANEGGINAFAAGLSTQHAVVAVTRGTLELLTRDELQGVIAHEFSHVLNGDMRLNLKLMGILHGILVIGLIGYWILRVGPRSSSAGNKKGGAAAILLLGVALLAIGYVGVLCGKLIKSALSRQREFLADASAVQFTRNPDGIAGALKKIGGLTAGSKLKNPNAEQASHLFFGNGVGKSWFAWLDTHPPLAERIRRIDPSFDGEFPRVELPKARERVEAAAAARKGRPAGFPFPFPAAGAAAGAGPAGTAVVLGAGVAAAAAADAAAAAAAMPATAAVAPPSRRLDPAKVAGAVGSPGPGHLAYIASLMDALPPELAADAREPTTARAVVAALLLDADPAVRRRQFDLLDGAGDPPLARRSRELAAAADRCPAAARLPLIDLAVPALRRLSPAQYREFRTLVEVLAAADRRVDLFEFTLQRLLLRHLAPSFGAAPSTAVQYYSLARLDGEVAVLLSALAWAGAGHSANAANAANAANTAEAARAFATAAARIPGPGDRLALLPADRCGLEALDAALTRLAAAAAPLRRPLIEAATAAIAADGRVTVEEGELLRAVADALDCPLPPLLPGETLTGAAA